MSARRGLSRVLGALRAQHAVCAQRALSALWTLYTLCAALLLAPASARGAEPSSPEPQALVYYNARVALRDGRPQDVLRLWLLRNALVREGQAPTHDDDFTSAVWVALAASGLCHDGLPKDDAPGGAGLWPLALHNWLVRSSSKEPPPEQPNTFSSFDAGFQQRQISLYDILSLEELRATRFERGRCLRIFLELPGLGTPHALQLEDRLSVGITLRDLLERSKETLRHERVRGQAVLDTRLFDLDLALARLARAAARRETDLISQLARASGVSDSAVVLARERKLEKARASEHAALLRRSLEWDELEWFSLRQDRRVALFAEALETYTPDESMREALRRTYLQNVDALTRRGRGAELSLWLGFLAPAAPTVSNPSPARDEALIREVVLGERGERVLALGPDEGFRERAAVALWRGVDALERGRVLEAMRSFALAMQRSDESPQADETHRLAKRWFAYVLSQHQADEESLALLRELVPPLERNELLEVLLWRAAFHADAASFARIAASARRGGALDARIRQLEPLANGDVGGTFRLVREDMGENRHLGYRFVRQLTDELSTEPLDVRLRNLPTLRLAKALLLELDDERNRGLQRRVHEQLERVQTLLDALGEHDETPSGRARTVAPGAPAYAGSLRLAPADPLPWPFTRPTPQPPSPFSPLELVPVEWRDADGARVFGWHIREQGE